MNVVSKVSRIWDITLHGTMAPPAVTWKASYGRLGTGRLGTCKGNLTDLRRILHLSLAKGNPKRTL
jgi:hypothetical protein